MEIEDIKRVLTEHEKRISNLEVQKTEAIIVKPRSGQKNYKGLSGGIRFLIDNNFMNEPKSIPEIEGELKREGYHYSTVGIASTLSETFHKSQKRLNRIRDGKIWRYVIRK